MKLTEDEDYYYLEGTAACTDCKATGLYQGFAEGNGAAVVCHTCEGTAKVKIDRKIPKFKDRKIKDGVKRVYDGSHGYGISAEDVTTEEGDFFPFSEWGCSYEEWLNGADPVPMRGLICPYLHTNQDLQSEDVNDLYKTRCRKNPRCGSITACPLRSEKEKCWEIYEGKTKEEENE